MKKLSIAILFTCACYYTQAQVNFVKNPGFEQFYHCPKAYDQIDSAIYWYNAVDSTFRYGAEYYNKCATGNILTGVPSNGHFFQDPHSGNGFAGIVTYYNGTTPYPPSPLTTNWRDYIQSRLHKNLIGGKSYCVTFYVNMAEGSGYAHDKLGAYLDDGTFDDTVSNPSNTMTFVTPQVFSSIILKDTARWERIEGTFIATGNERYITIGNFFANSSLSKVVTNYWSHLDQYSYYLIDDVSVIETDLPADAGADKWVPIGDSVWVGRNLDSTGWLDSKWYHHGSLIDSGAGIWVKGTVVGNTDTYAVVQTVCGLVKIDTVVILTASVGIHELPPLNNQHYVVFPNPSNGEVTIKQLSTVTQAINLQVYDMMGKLVYTEDNPHFFNSELHLKVQLPTGSYLVCIEIDGGFRQKLKLFIR